MSIFGVVSAAAFASAFIGPQVLAATVIYAGHLIGEPGKPESTNKSVIIENGKIIAIKDGFVAGDTRIDLKDSWVMPGLIDMHTHVSGVEKLDEPVGGQIALFYMGRPAEAVLNTLPRAKALLMNGFTTIRNVGDPTLTTYALRNAINAGIVPGPRMFVSEVQISVAGGDFDASNWDVRNDLEKYVSNRGNCSGVAECIKVVREEVRRGADVIKFRQAGLPAEDPRVKMVETPEEIKAIIDTAHQLDRKVAVHVTGTPEFLHAVIEAGADTIEHGPLDDASIALMRKHGTANTPTLLAAAGLPPAQVLRAATINAAAALGHLGDGLGSIAPGKIADIIAMKIDPMLHVDQLGAPGKVSFVMKEGTVFKDER